jgi:hypothetical protein
LLFAVTVEFDQKVDVALIDGKHLAHGGTIPQRGLKVKKR